ncbi:MAG: DUF3097 family protein [Agromyces sp.]
MSWEERYGQDVLAGDWKTAQRRTVPSVPLEIGRVLEHVDGFVGAVISWEKGRVELEDRFGSRRWFPIGHGYLDDGQAVQTVLPAAAEPGRDRTASGSFSAPLDRARTARASRIFVEGRHDAELIERVWGADLRVEGIVIELLDGADRLDSALAEFAPKPNRRAGVLLDHLVPGSKESRLAAAVRSGEWREHVLVLGHPYVDVWQSVRPERLGWSSWPLVPRDLEWKRGVCAAAGWPHAEPADIAAAWQRILATVRDYRDLEPELLGRVEELIDFVTRER